MGFQLWAYAELLKLIVVVVVSSENVMGQIHQNPMKIPQKTHNFNF